MWCNVFIRQAEYIGMANIAQSVNVISPLMTTKDGLVKQTTWMPYLLFCRYMRGHALAVHLQCGEYEGPTKPEWLRGKMETPWLDVSAAVSDDGAISLVVVNVHGIRSFPSLVEGIPVAAKVDVFTVTGPSVASVNTAEKSEVLIAESTWVAGGLYEFPKASMTMLRWKP